MRKLILGLLICLCLANMANAQKDGGGKPDRPDKPCPERPGRPECPPDPPEKPCPEPKGDGDKNKPKG